MRGTGCGHAAPDMRTNTLPLHAAGRQPPADPLQWTPSGDVGEGLVVPRKPRAARQERQCSGGGRPHRSRSCGQQSESPQSKAPSARK